MNEVKKDSLGEKEAWAKWEKGYMDRTHKFKGTKFEQNTFFIEDPHGNVLELKTSSRSVLLSPVIASISDLRILFCLSLLSLTCG